MRLEKKARVKKEIEETAIESKQYEDKKPEIKREIGRKGNVFGNLGKRLFQRKAI